MDKFYDWMSFILKFYRFRRRYTSSYLFKSYRLNLLQLNWTLFSSSITFVGITFQVL